ncbi:MAG: hypothetical protein AB1638_06325 [Nitrospirota bacterium]
MKKNNQKTEREFSLFPDAIKKNNDKFMREEIHLAKYPLCLFSNKEKKTVVVFYPVPGVEWKLMANKAAESDIPIGRHLDYLYAMLYMLSEDTQYRFDRNTIYFTLNRLVLTAGKSPCKPEYDTAREAIKNYKWLGIKSTLFKVWEDEEPKTVERTISIIQDYTIIEANKKGRKASFEEDPSGYCTVIFSDYIMKNLRSLQMSKRLNFSFMLKLGSPLARRYFRLIDAWKEEEALYGRDITSMEKDISEIAAQIPIQDGTHDVYIKRRIDPVHKKLQQLHYLKRADYIKNGKSTKVLWFFSDFNSHEALAFNELTRRGVSEIASKNFILRDGIPVQKIMDCICYYDIVCEQKKKENKAIGPSYLVKVLNDTDYELVKITIHERKKMEEARRREEALIREEEARMLYENFCYRKIQKEMSRLSEGEQFRLREEATAAADKINKYKIVETNKTSMAIAMAEIMKRKINLPTFEDWYKSKGNEATSEDHYL